VRWFVVRSCYGDCNLALVTLTEGIEMRIVFFGMCLVFAGTANAQDCANGRCTLPKAVAMVVAPVVGVVDAVVESRPVQRVATVTYRVALGPDRLLRRHRVRYGR